MENAPVIDMTFMNFAPGTEDETVRRYFNWIDEAYNQENEDIKGFY